MMYAKIQEGIKNGRVERVNMRGLCLLTRVKSG